jgi:hypothetical protein
LTNIGVFGYNTSIANKKDHMKYTLITPTGRVFTFFLRSTADIYQSAYGGVVFSQQIVHDQLVTAG